MLVQGRMAHRATDPALPKVSAANHKQVYKATSWAWPYSLNPLPLPSAWPHNAEQHGPTSACVQSPAVFNGIPFGHKGLSRWLILKEWGLVVYLLLLLLQLGALGKRISLSSGAIVPPYHVGQDLAHHRIYKLKHVGDGRGHLCRCSSSETNRIYASK